MNVLLILINLATFLLVTYIIWYLPGSIFFYRNGKLPKLDRIFFSVTLGFAAYSLLVFIFRFLQLPFWLTYIPFLIISLNNLIKFNKRKFSISFPKLSSSDKTLILIILIGTVIQGIALMKSAIQSNAGLRFLEISAHDSLQHVYLINELKENFPPRHPGFAPVLVKNYHFLLDLILASLGKYLPLSTYELYYRIIPAVISVFLGISVFIFTRRLTGKEWLANAAVFLAYFSGNASWFFKNFRGSEFKVSANTFMLDPVIDLMQNPIAVIVFPLLLAGLMGLEFLEKKFSWHWLLFSALTLGIIIGFKAWGGVLVLITLPFFALLMSIQKGRHYGWLVLLATAVIALVLFIPVYEKNTAANLVFVPGWLLKRMTEDPDRYNMQKFYFLEQYYRETNNVLQLVKINVIEVIIFIFGNLWTRIIAFIYLVHLMRKPTPSGIMTVFLIIFSLSLPLLFNQGRMAYDVIQFGPYSLLLMSIFTAAAFGIPNKIPKWLLFILLVLTLILSVPSNIPSIITRNRSQSFLLTPVELEAFDWVKKQTETQSVLLIYPSQRNDALLEIAALTGRPTYYSGKSFSRITGENFNEKNEKWRNFFRNIDPEQRNKVIREGSIDYLLLRSEEEIKFNPAGLNLEEVFSNSSYKIFRVK